jgi:hypothetical protein
MISTAVLLLAQGAVAKQATPATSASSCASGEYFVNVTSACADCNATSGECQDSSCVVFGFANSAKANCENNKCDPNYCGYFGGCTVTAQSQCFGTVLCSDLTTTCSSYGSLCLQDGSSGNFKICGGSSTVVDSPSTSQSPSPSKSPSPSPSPSGSKSPLPSPPKSPAPSHTPAASQSPLPMQSPAPTSSPAASQSPAASLSPNPSPSASPTPSPTAEACAAVTTELEGQFQSFKPCGCSVTFIEGIMQTYNCSEINPASGCLSYVCSNPITTEVAAQLALCQSP